MDKNAKELIQKLATLNPVKAFKHHTYKSMAKGAAGGLAAGTLLGAAATKKDEHKKKASEMIQKLASCGGSSSSPAKVHAFYAKKGKDPEKKASMKNIIDDIIKGAEQNTFGRPVTIQANTEFTPLDMAKVAGAMVALKEKGYSVKEAAEYLSLTAAQVEDIVKTVG